MSQIPGAFQTSSSKGTGSCSNDLDQISAIENPETVVEKAKPKRTRIRTSNRICSNPGFKYVPYSDKDDEAKAFRDELRLNYPGELSTTVGPVFQVIAINISNISNPHWDMLEIYGQISITDNKNNIFFIYNAEPDEDERISYIYDELQLNRSSIAPIREGGALNFSMFCKDDCEPIFEEHYDLDKNSIEGTSTLVLEGKEKYRDYRASIVFTRIPFAIVVNVEFFIQFKTKYPKTHGTEEVYGTIKVNKSLCNERSGHHPIKMKHGQCYGFHLSRSVFAVPANSPLEVEIRLLNDDEYVVHDTIQVYPSRGVPSESYNLQFPGKNRKFTFGMNIDWMLHEPVFGLPYHRLDPANVPSMNQTSPFFKIYTVKAELYKFCTRAKFQMNHSNGAVTSDDNPLVEIFSIIVCGRDASTHPNNIHGVILVCDQHESGYIFNSNVNGPDKLSDEQFGTLSIALPPRWIVEKDFLMHLKLEDVAGRPICTGRFCWAQWDLEYLLRDRRVCDFIEGENGYFVAVHYSIFRHGKRARVFAKWKSHRCFVYGSIVVAYSNCDYSSAYDKKYYQSVLFNKSERDCVKMGKDCQIPLLKSHISTSSNCVGLTVHVELWMREASDDSSMFERRKYSLKFEADKSGWMYSAVKHLGNIAVRVEWM